MINKRLTCFLESNNYITQFQSCFRSDRSTTDNLVRLETFIRVAFIKREHVKLIIPRGKPHYPSLVLVQPRKTRPYITESFLMGRKKMIPRGDTAFLKMSLITSLNAFCVN